MLPPVRFEIASRNSLSVNIVKRNSSLICSAACCTFAGGRLIRAAAWMSKTVIRNFVSHLPLFVRGLLTSYECRLVAEYGVNILHCLSEENGVGLQVLAIPWGVLPHVLVEKAF